MINDSIFVREFGVMRGIGWVEKGSGGKKEDSVN